MTTPLLRTALPLVAAITFAAGIASAGGPATPLGTWMKSNMGTALAGQDWAALQKNFDVVAGKPPPSGDYGDWAKFAKAGKDAAAKSDQAGVKAACGSCHNSYKEKYRKDFPTRAFP
jgi:hypothetical protein